MSDRRPGRQPQYVIYTLLDSQGKAGYVGVRRADEKPPRWTLIWNNRQAIGSSSKLVEWFNSLPAPPAEEVVLGKAASWAAPLWVMIASISGVVYWG